IAELQRSEGTVEDHGWEPERARSPPRGSGVRYLREILRGPPAENRLPAHPDRPAGPGALSGSHGSSDRVHAPAVIGGRKFFGQMLCMVKSFGSRSAGAAGAVVPG